MKNLTNKMILLLLALCSLQVAYSQCTFNSSISVQSGGSYAVLIASASGGQAPYSYNWSNNMGGSNIVTVVQSGTYCVTITDTVGCVSVVCDSLHLLCNMNTNFSYSNNGTGLYTFNATQSGGTNPILYGWYIDNNTPTGPTPNTSYAYTLSTGYHTVCVYAQDSGNRCFDSTCHTIYNGVGCNIGGAIGTQNNGTYAILTANVTGGTGQYTYQWSPTLSTSNIVTVQQSGVYCVTVTDTTGCQISMCDTVHLSSTCNMTIALYDSVVPVGYRGIWPQIIGGTAPYSYHWNNNYTGFQNTVNQNGYYCLTVTDHNGCTARACDSINLNTPTCQASFQVWDTCTGFWFQNYSAGSGLSYYWRFGDGDTSTSSYPVHHYAATGTYMATLIVSNGSGCVDSITQTVTVYTTNCNATDTICGTVFNDANGNGVQDVGEYGLAGQAIQLSNGVTAYTDSSGYYWVVVSAGIYNINYYQNSNNTISVPVNSNGWFGYYDTILITGGTHHCGFDFGVTSTAVTIEGYVYIDANNNNIMDAGETGIPYATVNVGGNYTYTDYYGFYTITLPVGTYTVTYISNPSYSGLTVSPSSHTVIANTVGNIYSNNNFGLHGTAGCNVALTIIPHTTVTAGYPAWYSIYVDNYGSTAVNGTVTFYYDPSLTATSVPAGATINTSAHSITWNYTNLLPVGNQSYWLDFNAFTSVTIGQPTFELATVTANCNETNYADNTDTVHQNATASWDPNNKIATPSGTGAAGYIARTQELRYTINFQNTGTSPAVNVVLKDLLPNTLDLSTLKVIGASHPNFAVQVDGNMLICRFSQIMLPDSHSNRLGSHGYLSFAVKPKTTDVPGTTIQNGASIYFDYNSAVVTNTTLNTIEYPLSIQDLENHATITVVPNPMKDYTTISVIGINTTDAQLEVYNMLGQKAGAGTPMIGGVFNFNRGNLGAGVYIYHIKQADKVIGTGKLVVE